MEIELRRLRVGLAGVLLAALAAACSGPAPPPAAAPTASPDPVVRVAAPSPSPAAAPAARPSPAAPPPSPGSAASPAALPSPSIEPRAAPLVERAVADAAQRTGLAPAAVRVVQVEAREWRDASLGCPRPGQMYAQVLTPGFLIVLDAAGQRLEYHADSGRRVELCP